jgi:hypothetical protein
MWLIYLVIISPKREIPKREIVKRSYFWRFSVARNEREEKNKIKGNSYIIWFSLL